MQRSTFVGAAAASILVAATVYVVAAPADRTMAYRGRLELNGAPAEGLHDMGFSFFDDPTAGNLLGAGVARFDVPVSGGEFSVELPLPEAALAATSVYLAVRVRPAGSGPYVPLGQRQRIFAVPFAMRGRHDGTFVVDGALSASSTVTAVAGEVVLGQSGGGAGTRTLEFRRETGDEANAGKVTYRSFGPELDIVGAGASGNRVIKLWDDVQVNDALTVGGDLRVSGTALLQATGWCDCERESERVNSSGTVLTAQVPFNFLWEDSSGAGIYQCRGGRFLVGIEKTSTACTSSIGCLEQYKCCRPCSLRAQ